MSNPPSQPLLALLRDTARKKGWNTATLSHVSGIERNRLKQVLGGKRPLTVDDLVQLCQAMKMGATDLRDFMPVEEGIASTPPQFDESAEPSCLPNPFGNHAEQLFRIGFALGCDIFFTVHTKDLSDSGVPQNVINNFAPTLPVRLEAALHRHNDPQYLPEGIQLRLSFDAVYTCLFPWSSIEQLTFFPTPCVAPNPQEEPAHTKQNTPHLRLIE